MPKTPPTRESRRIRAPDGLALALDVRGPADGAPVVFAHGFGQTRHAWAATAASLAANGYRTIAADGRGHGDSEWRADGAYDMDQFVADLVAIAHDVGARPALVGASMGGLVALLAEADHGPLFGALVLVDITPRWEPDGVARILAFMRAHPDGFDSLDHAAEAIATYLPQRRERKSPERLKSLLVARDDGRLRWHWDPRLLERIASDGERQQQRLLDAARRIDVPLLLISGGASDIVSDSTIAEFLALAPRAEHVAVPHATHMVAGDDNDVFTAHVLEFLNAHTARPSSRGGAFAPNRQELPT